jgi:hypothetical protein
VHKGGVQLRVARAYARKRMIEAQRTRCGRTTKTLIYGLRDESMVSETEYPIRSLFTSSRSLKGTAYCRQVMIT